MRKHSAFDLRQVLKLARILWEERQGQKQKAWLEEPTLKQKLHEAMLTLMFAEVPASSL